MVSVKDKKLSHGFGEGGGDVVSPPWHRKAHMQKIRRVFQLVLWINERLADGIFVSHCSEGRHFCYHVDTCHLALRLIFVIDRVVIESRECPDHTDHYRHRMRIAAEPGVESGHLLIHHSVLDDAMFKRGVLLGSRQIAVEQQVTRFKKGTMLRELFDRIT